MFFFKSSVKSFANLLFHSRPMVNLLECPRYLHQSTRLFKRRKTAEERQNPKKISYSPKSKWKQSEVASVWKNITVEELAQQLGRDVNHVFDVMQFVNDSINYNKPSSVIDNFRVVEEVVKKSGMRFKMEQINLDCEKKIKDAVRRDKNSYRDVRSRPAIVTVMGHVDHGKTTLLDNLRNTSVVDKEYGGITQHIGAFSVLLGNERITFLDTPGHAAFCAMRNRGAQCTDIVVLVVAADDGVKEQTVESIKMAQQSRVPIIVAINKIDRPNADIETCKRELVQYSLQAEDLGGDVQMVPISALKGTNIKSLIEALLAQAELMELKTDYSGMSESIVLESANDPQRGKLCTLLVQVGTLKRGAVIVAGTAKCKVRLIFDECGATLEEAPPSLPVQVAGWRDLPSPGDIALEVESEKRATEVITWRLRKKMEEKQAEDAEQIKLKSEEHYKAYRERLEKKRLLGKFRMKPEERKKESSGQEEEPRLNVIIKADVDGSLEALLDVLDSYSSSLCKLDVVHHGVGPVSLGDIALAETFSANIYTFNTHVLQDSKVSAEEKNILIKPHNVIYKLIDNIKADINDLLPLKDVEEVIGEGNVQQEFIVTEGKVKVSVAGCKCTRGVLKKSGKFRLERNGTVIFDGQAVSIRHLKDEVDVIKKDVECGLRLQDGSIKFQPGDTIICYIINKVPQESDWDPGF